MKDIKIGLEGVNHKDKDIHERMKLVILVEMYGINT